MVKNSIHILLLLLSFSLLLAPAFADILPPNSHYVERCVKISNLEQYPSIVIITQDLPISGDEQKLSIAKSGECLSAPSYKFNGYKIYWTEKSYASSISLQNLKLKNASYGASSIDDANIHFITSSISTSGGYEDNSNPATREEVSYAIEANPAGGYTLVKAGAAGVNNGTAPPGPAKPSAPSKPVQPPPTPPPSIDGTSAVLYMLLVLVLGAAAIFIIIKSMSHAHPKPVPPAGEEPVESASELSSAPSTEAPPSSRPSGKTAGRKKRA